MVDKYWQLVAQRFKDVEGIIAYEMLNEPWFGDIIDKPELFLKAGVGENAITNFYERIHSIIRSEDPDTPVLFAPIEMNNRMMRNVGFKEGFLPNEPMAFHVYCITGTDSDGPSSKFTKALCHLNDYFQVKPREEDLRRL